MQIFVFPLFKNIFVLLQSNVYPGLDRVVIANLDGSYVFYTSAHSGINITELKDTLLHRVYPDVWKYDVPYQVRIPAII